MSDRAAVTLHRLSRMRSQGEPIAMLTCYDAAFARLLDAAGVDVLLVGDSLGMVLQGNVSTLGVSMPDMVYHTRSVARAAPLAWIIADMPFGSYQSSTESAVHNASLLMQAGAQMVKVEGGWVAPLVATLAERGIPVCGHLGFTPQSVHALGGYRIQGRDQAGASLLLRQAKELAAAGAQMLILELVPSALAREVTAALDIPVIGIGAGSGCNGQVLVLHDMLNVTHGKVPRFVRNFMAGSTSIQDAARRYVEDVKSRVFPNDAEHGYE